MRIVEHKWAQRETEYALIIGFIKINEIPCHIEIMLLSFRLDKHFFDQNKEMRQR